MASYSTIPSVDEEHLLKKPTSKSSLKGLVFGAAAASFVLGMLAATAVSVSVAQQGRGSAFNVENRLDVSALAPALTAPTAKCLSDTVYCQSAPQNQRFSGQEICQRLTDDIYNLMASNTGEKISFKNHGGADLPLYITLGKCTGSACPVYSTQETLPICDTGFVIPPTGKTLNFPWGFSGNFHMSPGTSKQGTLFEVTFDASTGNSHADISIIPSGCPGTCYGDSTHKKGDPSNVATCDTMCDSCPDATPTENCIPVKDGTCYGVDACPTSVWAAKKSNYKSTYQTQAGLLQCCKDRGGNDDGFDFGIKMTPSTTSNPDCRAIDCFDPTKDDQCVFAYKTPHNDNEKLFSCTQGVEWTIDIYPKGTTTPAPVELPHSPQIPPAQSDQCSETTVLAYKCAPDQWINTSPGPALGQCQNPPLPAGYTFCRNWAIY